MELGTCELWDHIYEREKAKDTDWNEETAKKCNGIQNRNGRRQTFVLATGLGRSIIRKSFLKGQFFHSHKLYLEAVSGERAPT